MIKKEKGITLVSLIITVVVIIIVASMVVSTSLERFKINNLRKMVNDIELLNDKVSNYYSQYRALPILRDSSNNPIEYNVGALDFLREDDQGKYYIVDLEAMDGISLNYGDEGFYDYKDFNTSESKDIYIINEYTHAIYYVKGIELKGKIYHYITHEVLSLVDDVPPTKPQTKVLSGINSGEKIEGIPIYKSVEIEIIPGKDNWSGVEKTEYELRRYHEYRYITYSDYDVIKRDTIAGSSVLKIAEDNICIYSGNTDPIILEESPNDGAYELLVKSIDYNGNKSKIETFQIALDFTPPDAPTINVLGEQKKEGTIYYTSDVKIEIIEGPDNFVDTTKTEWQITYTGLIDNDIISSGYFDSDSKEITPHEVTHKGVTYKMLSDDGEYTITTWSYDKLGNGPGIKTEKVIWIDQRYT